MSLQLHNTLTRRVEPFTALAPPRVTLYTCGPTVWNFAHIGNFRTFLFEDLLRRHLEWSGFDVYHIMNLTDVDDRVIKAAAAAGKRPVAAGVAGGDAAGEPVGGVSGATRAVGESAGLRGLSQRRVRAVEPAGRHRLTSV